MSDLINKAKDLVGKHEDKKATPGDGIERKADDFANQRVYLLQSTRPCLRVIRVAMHLRTDECYAEANNIAGREGVPQQDDGMLDKAVDAKVNEKIPGGN